MNKLTFMVLIFLIGIGLYLIYHVLHKFQTYAKATHISFKNKLYCGDIYCPENIFTIIPTLPLISTFQSTWKPLTALYCANLILRTEYADTDPNHQVLPPSNQTFIGSFRYKNEDAPIGMVTTNNNITWLSFRGTASMLEWSVDFDFIEHNWLQEPTGISTRLLGTVNQTAPFVHEGFYNMYLSLRPSILQLLSKSTKNIYITGHSLGAALATIAGIDLTNRGYTCIVYNFGSPRIGDSTFASLIQQKIILYRIVNMEDMIPSLPLSVSPNIDHPNQPFFFSHGGKVVPFSVNWKSLLNNHLLGAYIHGIQQL